MKPTTQDLLNHVVCYWTTLKDAIEDEDTRGIAESDLEGLRNANKFLYDVTESLAEFLEGREQH